MENENDWKFWYESLERKHINSSLWENENYWIKELYVKISMLISAGDVKNLMKYTFIILYTYMYMVNTDLISNMDGGNPKIYTDNAMNENLAELESPLLEEIVKHRIKKL